MKKVSLLLLIATFPLYLFCQPCNEIALDSIIPDQTIEEDSLILKKSARKVVIPDAGHIMEMDKPTEFNKIILDFLKTVPPVLTVKSNSIIDTTDSFIAELAFPYSTHRKVRLHSTWCFQSHLSFSQQIINTSKS